MARPCTVCKSGHVTAVDRALARGESLAVLARRYRLSTDALLRHKKHATQFAETVPVSDDASTRDAEFDAIVADLLRLQAASEMKDDVRGATAVLQQRLAAWRVQSEVLDNRPKERFGLQVYRKIEAKLFSPAAEQARYKTQRAALLQLGYEGEKAEKILAALGLDLPPAPV